MTKPLAPPIPVIPSGNCEILGRVLSADGTPAGGASVVAAPAESISGCSGEDSAATAVLTDEDGTFALTKLEPRVYLVWAKTESQMSDNTKLAARTTNPPYCEFNLDSEVAPIQGIVVDGAGNGIAGASLALRGVDKQPASAGTSLGRSVVTDQRGLFTAPGAPGQSYQYFVCAPGYAAVLTEWIIAPAENVRIVLGTPLQLTGRVVMADTQEPVPNVKLLLAPPWAPYAGLQTRSDGKGAFQFDGVAAQDYELRLPGSSLVLVSGKQFAPVRVGPDMAPIEVEVMNGASVGGRVTFPDGSPVSGALVHLSNGLEYSQQSVPTGADGRYVLRGVPSGRYQASLITDNYSRLAQPRTFTVTAGAQIDNLDWVVQGVSVTGVTVTAKNAPAAGASVTLASADGKNGATSEFRGRSGEDGRFTVLGIPAEAGLTISAQLGELISGRLEFEQGADAAEQEVLVVLNTKLDGLLEGVVADTAGRTGKYLIELYADDPGHDPLHPQSQTNARGEFSFQVPTPGTFAVRVAKAGGRLEPPTPATLQLLPHQQLRGLRLTVPAEPGQSIRGRILSPERRPLLGVQVTGGNHIAFTNVEGEFELTWVAPGRYSLRAIHPDYPPLVIPDVGAGAMNVEGVFKVKSVITGTVSDKISHESIPALRIKILDAEGGILASQPAAYLDSAGAFSIETPVFQGQILLIFSAEGYAEQTVTLSARDRTSGIHVEMEPVAQAPG